MVIFIASICTGLLFWQMCSSLFFNPQLLPPPAKVFVAGWEMVKDGELFEMVSKSIVRIGIGFCVGCIVGISCGLLMGSF